ncbi:MAG: hypothetical protein IPG42_21340 [Betaproteobacteria bacterium]|nr:hypothetical protein [Betaproteobacteria bacterium]
MTNERPTPASVDDYIAGFSPEVQRMLQAARQVVRRAAPDAEEVISYQIPPTGRRESWCTLPPSRSTLAFTHR